MNHAVGPYDPCPCRSGKKFKFCCYSLRKDVAGSGAMFRAESTASSPNCKMSEMISEMAAGFLWVGDTIGERQNRLNAACAAWNMACGTSEVRQYQLEQYKEGYLRSNPATSLNDLANIVKDMETLIERKLTMFPSDKRQIVSAKVVKVGDNFRDRSRIGDVAMTGDERVARPPSV